MCMRVMCGIGDSKEEVLRYISSISGVWRWFQNLGDHSMFSSMIPGVSVFWEFRGVLGILYCYRRACFLGLLQVMSGKADHYV